MWAEIRKRFENNLVEKMKTIGINNPPIPSNFILTSVTNRKAKRSREIPESLNATQKTNFNTIQDPNSYERNTRESSHLEKTKRVSRKQKLKFNDTKKLSQDISTENVENPKIQKKLSISESAMKNNKRGSTTTRTVVKSKKTEREDKKSIDTIGSRTKSQVLSDIISPEGSNPQQPSFPKKTWPMKPGYWLKTFSNELSEFEKGEILQYRQIYFVGSKAEKVNAGPWHEFNNGYDDDKGNYKIITSDQVAYRYEIIDSLGKGSFGNVLKWWDHKNK